MNQIVRARWNQIRVVVVPALVLMAALGWLVVDGQRMRSKLLGKYALPNDHSPKSMLEFMRKMDGSVQLSDSLLETSNIESTCNAVTKAYAELEQDSKGLTDDEKREANFYRLRFLCISILKDLVPNAASEVDRYVIESKQFLNSSKKTTSREQQIAQITIQLLDNLGRFDEERAFCSWMLAQMNQRSDDSSDAASATSQAVKKAAKRLEMLNEILVLQSHTLDGQAFDLASLRGKVVLLEFWGTHCKPCIADFPALKRIYATNKPLGFEIVSVCLHAAPARIQSFSAEHQLPWIQLCEDQSASEECNQVLSERFGVQAVPTTLLINPDGRVVALGLRPLAGDSQRDLEHWLQELLPGVPRK